MALDIWRTLETGGILFAEAGTGTGKSLAYLIPAALWGSPVLISTGTRNLQEQLYWQDIPVLRKILDSPLDAVIVKGRNNYLCRKRWDDVQSQGILNTGFKRDDWNRLSEWVSTTRTGDRAEMEFLPDTSRLWQNVCSRSETCLGPRCRHYNDCFVVRLKIKAQQADIVIANHHLFFADAVLRSRKRISALPSVGAVIFDEAHLVDDIATGFLGIRINHRDILDFLSLIQLFARNGSNRKKWKLDKPIQKLREASAVYFGLFGLGEGRFSLESRYGEELNRQASILAGSAENLLQTMTRERAIPDESRNELEFRLRDIADSIAFLDQMSDPDYVFWGEHTQAGPILHANPIEIARDLPGLIRQSLRPLVFTSATLTVRNSFEYIISRLGFDVSETRCYPSPFDYPQQAVLYLPDHLPGPDDPDFYRQISGEIKRILDVSRGRAFILCTSYRGMDIIREEIKSDLDYPLCVQGESPKHVLLERFRSDGHSVLIGTASFWQGVDVPGPALSCVIIDKLPFSIPTDPVIKARIEKIRMMGGDAFNDFQIPEAVMILKQGLGRLIRSRSDRGIAAILDHRVFTKSYGRAFLDSIPEFTRTHDFNELSAFLE